MQSYEIIYEIIRNHWKSLEIIETIKNHGQFGSPSVVPS
jgi:hypothetical protein